MSDHGPENRETTATQSSVAQVERIVSLATSLLIALRPWDMQRAEVRSAATRLTVALAAWTPSGEQEQAQ